MKQRIDVASTRTDKTTSKCVIGTPNKCMLKNKCRCSLPRTWTNAASVASQFSGEPSDIFEPELGVSAPLV